VHHYDMILKPVYNFAFIQVSMTRYGQCCRSHFSFVYTVHSKASLSFLFREIIAVYSDNHTKPTNTLCGQNAESLVAKSGSICICSWDFNG
jgi:hypothetical protein